MSSFGDRLLLLIASGGKVPSDQPAQCEPVAPVMWQPFQPKAHESVAITPAQRIIAAIAAACMVAAPLATRWEGYARKVYYDPAHIPTYCYGETSNPDPSRIYSQTFCANLLRQRMARDYAPRIARCLPQVVDNRFVFGALIDASYNTGWSAVCHSSVARAARRGDLLGTCNALVGWYDTALNRRTGRRFKPPGLAKRRLDERAVCMRGVV